LIVATPGEPEDQVPPHGVQNNTEVLPTHIAIVPVITPGDATMTITVDAEHPVGSVYVITTVPGKIVVTIPLEDPTVAMVTLLLVHTPPVGVPVKVTVLPAQTVVPTVEPRILGVGFTVTTVVAKQPLGII